MVSQVKRLVKVALRYMKALHSLEGIRKGNLFYQKWYIKGSGLRPRGGASPYKALFSASPRGDLYGVLMSCFNFSQRTFKADGLEAVRKGENSKAIDLLQLSLKHEQTSVDEQRKMLQLLCDLYFKEKSFNECLETGRKLKATYWGEKNEVNNDSSVRYHIVMA